MSRQSFLLLDMPPGKGQLPHVTGQEPLLSWFVLVGLNGEEVPDWVAEYHLSWTESRVSVWSILMGQQGSLEVVSVQASVGGHVLPQHPFCRLNTEFGSLVRMGEMSRGESVFIPPVSQELLGG